MFLMKDTRMFTVKTDIHEFCSTVYLYSTVYLSLYSSSIASKLAQLTVVIRGSSVLAISDRVIITAKKVPGGL